MLLAAPVWHWWLSVPLVGGAVVLVLAIVVGYLMKVVAPKYPRQ